MDQLKEDIIMSSQKTSNRQKNPYISTSEKNKKTYGYVSNCKKLNVRKAASKDSEVVSVIDLNAKVEILIKNADNSGFVKVITSDNKIGYCMKEYITMPVDPEPKMDEKTENESEKIEDVL